LLRLLQELELEPCRKQNATCNHKWTVSLKQNDTQYAQLESVIVRTNKKGKTHQIIFHALGKISMKNQ
jgi:hypothetical protein